MTLPCYVLVENNLSGDPFHNQFTEERVDLSVFSPACLPDVGETFSYQNGHVYGESCKPMMKFLFCLYLRLGRHWSPRDLHRQAARDCSSHCRKQQVYWENEPHWNCGRRPNCLCRGCCSWTMQGESSSTMSPNLYYLSYRATVVGHLQ